MRGRYRQGTIELDEPLDLHDGTEVMVAVTPSPAAPDESDASAATPGAWAGNVPDDFEAQVYADRSREAARPAAQW